MPALSVTGIALTKLILDIGGVQRIRGAISRLSADISTFSNEVASSIGNHDNDFREANSNRSTSSSHRQASSSSITTNQAHAGIESPPNKTSSQFDYLWEQLQTLLLWDNVFHSLVAINILNFLFYVARGWAPNFYSSLMFIMFCHNFSKLWFCYIWPEIRVAPEEDHDVDRWTYLDPHLLTLPELMSYLSDFAAAIGTKLNTLAQMRSARPGTFCLLVCLVLTIVAALGNLVKGINIIYFIVLAIYTAPGIYIYLLPDHIKIAIHAYLLSIIPTKAQNITRADQVYSIKGLHGNFLGDKHSVLSDDNSELDKSPTTYEESMRATNVSISPTQIHTSPNKQSDQYIKIYPSVETSASDKTLNWFRTGVDISRSYFEGNHKPEDSLYIGEPSNVNRNLEDNLQTIERKSSSSCDDDEFEIISENELQMVPKSDKDILTESGLLRQRLNSNKS